MKRELERIEIPGEYDARRRTWEVVRAAYDEREPVSWPRRHVRALALAAAAVALVAAAVTPPGRSVVNAIRDAVGREKVVGVRDAEPELVRLPAPGRLLVQSPRGAWVVQRDGSRRLLGPYRDASWSPRGLFVAGVLRRPRARRARAERHRPLGEAAACSASPSRAGRSRAIASRTSPARACA